MERIQDFAANIAQMTQTATLRLNVSYSYDMRGDVHVITMHLGNKVQDESPNAGRIPDRAQAS